MEGESTYAWESNEQELSEWLCDSNKAFSIQLCRSPQDEPTGEGDVVAAVEPFHPTFTYPIFGEREKIFGYKQIQIEYHLCSGSLKQMLNISYKDKYKSATLPADDVEGTLYKYIPSDYLKDKDAFVKLVQTEADSFTPPGERVATYQPNAVASSSKKQLNGSSSASIDFDIYRCTWTTPGFRDMHRRMQLFILLEVEGGSYIREDEDQWEFLVLFERRTMGSRTTHHFVGYVSAFPFWCYPDSVRMRLSQFVILPPYRRQGHGSHLYNALFDYVLTQPKVTELTIEDPSEAFEDLRDRNDVKRLRTTLKDSPQLAKGAPVDKQWLETVRKEGKYAKRQFSRLIEMLLLECLGGKEDKAYRLQVKERLYRFNYELLNQIDEKERKIKLQETYDNIVEHYKQILNL